MRARHAFCIRWVIGCVLLVLAIPLYAQDTARYSALVNQAAGLYERKQYGESARKYEEAFAAAGGPGRMVDRFNAACSWSLAGGADEAFRHLEWLAANDLFTRIDWITTDEDLRPLHGDPRWAPVVAAVRAHAERVEASRTPVGSFHYTRMMLLFNANAEALERRLPPGWVVSREGANIVIGFCDVWASHDAAGRLVEASQVKYIPFNGGAWNQATGESINIRYTEYADHPRRLLAAAPEDVANGDVVPSRIVRQSRIEHSDSLGDVYHEHWRIEPEGGGVIELRASFVHGVSWSTSTSAMDVVYASNPSRRMHLRNEEMHNIITRPGGEGRLLDFEIKVDLPGWRDIFDGTERLLSVRFIPTSKREVFVYGR